MPMAMAMAIAVPAIIISKMNWLFKYLLAMLVALFCLSACWLVALATLSNGVHSSLANCYETIARNFWPENMNHVQLTVKIHYTSCEKGRQQNFFVELKFHGWTTTSRR